MGRKINVGNSAIVSTSASTLRYIQDIKKYPVLTKAEELAFVYFNVDHRSPFSVYLMQLNT